LISEGVLEALRSRWKYSINYGYWFKGDVKFEHMRHYILEVFDYDKHKYIDVEDRLVVDVGAGYNESAIRFILRGTRHVIAIEPCPDVFNELLENLRLNNIIDKVSPINKAIASTHGRINIECPSGNFVVDAVSLRDIVKNIDLDDAVLKMDCEGCEYDIILMNMNT
jgi:tRNA G37 N-methylase Trm5